MKTTVFIDGQHGTVGLRIREKLQLRSDIEVVEIPEELRKDSKARKQYINEADLVIFCLPDDAEKDSLPLIENSDTKVISTSTVFRTSEGWVYGLAELQPGQRELIQSTKRLANPGCYPTGFISILRPLISACIVPPDYPMSFWAITGYSGGGRKMIEEFEGAGPEKRKEIACRPKNLLLAHKHLPEMQKYSGLDYAPNFVPIVGDFYNGMLVHVPLINRLLLKQVTPDSVREILSQYYQSERFIRVISLEETRKIGDGFFAPSGVNGTNLVEILVSGNERNMVIVARLDNLGKGAATNAVQNMNLMLGYEESIGL